MSEKITVSYYRYRSVETVSFVPENPLEENYIVIVLEGSVTYAVNGQPVTVKAGEGLFLPRGTMRGRAEAPGHAKYYSMLFSDDEIESDRERINTVFSHEKVPEILWCASKIDRYYVARYYDVESSQRRISRLFYLMLDYCAEASSSEHQSKYVSEIIDYIRANYKSKLRIADIAESVHLNPAYCSTLFKEETGMTVGDFIAEYRLDIARDELIAGRTVREAAEAAGFTDPYNFSKWFSKNTGMPPSEYRVRSGIKRRRRK